MRSKRLEDSERVRAQWRDPTPEDLKDPVFNAIWSIIKDWDIDATKTGLYSYCTGTDAVRILDAVKATQK